MIHFLGHDITIPLALLIFSTGCVIGWLLKRSSLKELATDLVLMQRDQIKALSDEVKSLADDLVQANEQAKREHEQRVQTVECIAIIEKDRNTWQKKYWDAGYGHSVAQNLLVAEMTRLSRLLQRHNIPRSEANPACGQVVDEFQAKHLSTENRDKIGAHAIATLTDGSVDSAAKCST
jgi:hypothetical protein